MMKLIECVPNFSEGRNTATIQAITHEIEGVSGVTLLDVDPGQATNRTVVTFIGGPDEVLEAAFRGIRKASELIDLRQHHGAHARMGATDVCPFIPVSDVTVEECIDLSRRLAARVWAELQIPVFFYELSATSPERQNLATIRQGEYEGLAEKLKNPDWRPDVGEPVFNAKSGATVIGVREFLIAFNINLNTKSTKIAKRLALAIREKGRLKRDDNGKIMRDDAGIALREPGIFSHCKATGWFIQEYDCAQVTMNLTNFKVTPPHIVLETVRDLAQEEGIIVTGSELVGLIPLEGMLEAGRYYLRRQHASAGGSHRELIAVAIRSMGLEQIAPFDPLKKIIEFQVSRDNLVAKTVRSFADDTASDSPAPGGGSVSALAASLSAALSAMVANLSYEKKGFKELQPFLDDVACEAQELKERCLQAIDADTEAFNALMACYSLPKKTEQDIAARNDAIQQATRKATLVPLSVLKTIPTLLALSLKMVEKGNPNSLSDAGVACAMARAAAVGTYFNVIINLAGIVDTQFVDTIRQEAVTLKKQVDDTAAIIESQVNDRLLANIGVS